MAPTRYILPAQYRRCRRVPSVMCDTVPCATSGRPTHSLSCRPIRQPSCPQSPNILSRLFLLMPDRFRLCHKAGQACHAASHQFCCHRMALQQIVMDFSRLFFNVKKFIGIFSFVKVLNIQGP